MQAESKQPPIVIMEPTDILIPLDEILVVAFIGWCIAVRRKSRRAATAA